MSGAGIKSSICTTACGDTLLLARCAAVVSGWVLHAAMDHPPCAIEIIQMTEIVQVLDFNDIMSHSQ